MILCIFGELYDGLGDFVISAIDFEDAAFTMSVYSLSRADNLSV